MSLVKNIVSDLVKKGADKAQVMFQERTEQEFSMIGGEFSLLRTNQLKSVSLRIIKDQKKATMTINKTDEPSLNKAYEDLFNLCESSPADEAYNISTLTGDYSFESGSTKVDKEQATAYLESYMNECKKEFSKVAVREATLRHIFDRKETATSNDLFISEKVGGLSSMSLFTAKDGDNVTSMNFASGSHHDFSKPLMDSFNMKNSLKDTEHLLEAENLNEKFSGEVILTPGAFYFIVANALGHLGDSSMIAGTSYFKDKLGERVFSDKLSVELLADSNELVFKEFTTPDRFLAKNYKVFENGKLNNYILSQYGAHKTQLKQTFNSGSHFKISNGETGLSEMIKDIKKGIVVGYFSAGQPSSKGDFSGVAKNSFYIENGKITKALKEVMINGNVFDMLKGLKNVSKEVINDGQTIRPWAHIDKANISG